MIFKILNIFKRDIKSNSRDFIALYIITAPIIFAVAINIFVPSVNETSVTLALIEGENTEQVTYLENYAKLELLSSIDEVETRVMKRDNVFGVVKENGAYILINQGDEPPELTGYGKLLLDLYINDVDITESNVTLHDFENQVHPFRKLLVNVILLMITILGGMLIGINIVEEKVDNTVSAINVTTISRLGFIFGKSLIGLILSIYGPIAIVYLTGFGNANFFQLLTISIIGSLIGVLVGFFEGVKNTDIMEVAASIKMLFLPVLASVAAIELLALKWQIFFYWIPWYWMYKANDQILESTADWKTIGVYSIFILIPGVLSFIYLKSGIRKGLE